MAHGVELLHAKADLKPNALLAPAFPESQTEHYRVLELDTHSVVRGVLPKDMVKDTM